MLKSSLEYGRCLLCAKLLAQRLTQSRCLSIYVCATYLPFLSFPCGSTLVSLHPIQQTFIEPLPHAGNSTDSLLLCLFLPPLNVFALLEIKTCVKRKCLSLASTVLKGTT